MKRKKKRAADVSPKAAAAAVVALGEASIVATAAGVDWSKLLPNVKLKTLRTVYDFTRSVGFGADAGVDPSGLAEAVADELHSRQASAAKRAKFARRRGRRQP